MDLYLELFKLFACKNIPTIGCIFNNNLKRKHFEIFFSETFSFRNYKIRSVELSSGPRLRL